MLTTYTIGDLLEGCPGFKEWLWDLFSPGEPMPSTPSYALSLIWPSLSGSLQDKLAQLNAMTVTGPGVDVSIQQVAGFLLLNGIYPTIDTFAGTTNNGTQPHDGALLAAKTFLAWIGLQNAPLVHMSQPAVVSAVTQMGNAMVAQEEAAPGSTGFTQAVLDGLLALGQTTQPWWQANGFSGPVTSGDAAAAGLT